MAEDPKQSPSAVYLETKDQRNWAITEMLNLLLKIDLDSGDVYFLASGKWKRIKDADED